MKRTILIFVLVFIVVSCFATNPFKKGDVVNVWSPKGLLLYDNFELNSKQIARIPYGTTVTIVEAGLSARAIPLIFETDNPKKPFVLQSDWVKIRYNDMEGYVPAGNLSKMLCFNRTSSGFETSENYLQRICGKPRVGKRTGVIGKTKYTDTRKVYAGGYYTQSSQNGKCFENTIQFPQGTSYQDAILFEQVTLFDAKAVNDIKIFGAQIGRPTLRYYSCD